MKDDCLVLSVASRLLQYTNCKILKSTILSLTKYELLFLFVLFMIFPWVLSSSILLQRCYLLIFSGSINFISSLLILSRFFPQIANNNKNTVVKNRKLKICIRSCCHSNYFKIMNVSAGEHCSLYQLWKCRSDCKTIQMTVIKFDQKP